MAIGHQSNNAPTARDLTVWRWCVAVLNDGDYNYQSFNYINWGWSNSSEPYYRDEWKTWGDAQIQGTEVGELYIANMQHPHHQFKYLHAMPRDKIFDIIGCRME